MSYSHHGSKFYYGANVQCDQQNTKYDLHDAQYFCCLSSKVRPDTGTRWGICIHIGHWLLILHVYYVSETKKGYCIICGFEDLGVVYSTVQIHCTKD